MTDNEQPTLNKESSMSSDPVSNADSAEQRLGATEPPAKRAPAIKPVEETVARLDEAEQGSPEERPDRVTKRALLIKAGWAIPVILAVGLPQRALAQSPIGRTSHSDASFGHTDTPGSGRGHFDAIAGGRRGDSTRSGHGDSATGRHGDSL